MSAPHAKYGELSHENCIRIIDQLVQCGVQSVSLTGGECLVRKDFLELVDRMLSYGINIYTIYSNGALVNEKLLNELDSRGIHPEFNMSFDGVGQHDWIRGINGAEEAVIQAFKLCREKGFPTAAEMCLHRKTPIHCAKASTCSFPSAAVDASNLCMCGHARCDLYITAEGRMAPCMPLSGNDELLQKLSNLCEVNLAAALDDSYYMDLVNARLSEYLAHNKECASANGRTPAAPVAEAAVCRTAAEIILG